MRRLLHTLSEPHEQQVRRLHWSGFRRHHQATARQFQVLRRSLQAPSLSDQLPAPIPLPGLPVLSDEYWEQLRPLLPAQKPQTGRPATDHRLIVEGMLWVARTNSSWRELPERFGPWTTVASRYQRWCKEVCWLLSISVLQKSANVGSTSTFSLLSTHQIGVVRVSCMIVYVLIVEQIC